MADQNKQLPSFNFGNLGTAPPSSSGPDSSSTPRSPFGSAPSSNPFGNLTASSGAQSNPTPTTSSSPFAGFGATSGAQGGSLFGSSTGQPSTVFGGGAGNATGAGLFGGGNQSTGTGFSFGKQPNQTSGATSTPFSNLATPDKTPATGGMTGAGGIFGSGPPSSTGPPPGSITPSSIQAGPGLFGGIPSTTPAGNPPQPGTGIGHSVKPASGMFGTTSSGPAVPLLFPSNKPAESGPPKTTTSFGSTLFGRGPTSTTGGGFFGNQSGHTAQNPFGKGTPTSTDASTFPSISSPPAGPPPSKPTFNFGTPSTSGSQPAGTTATSQPSSNFFPPKTNAPTSSAPAAPFSTFNPSTSGSHLSSSAPTSGPGLFLQVSAPGTSAGFLPPSSSSARSGTTTASNPFGPAPGTSTTSGATTSGSGATTAAPAPSDAPGAPGASVMGNPAVGPAPSAQSRLRNKTMDEIITRWASDLTKYQKEFQSQAERVAAWDRMLVDNSEKIQKLYGRTLEAERATAEVEKQLSAVEGQQEELSYWLDSYEKDVEEMMARQVGQGEALQGPDQERERTYKLAERLSERLDDMGRDLSIMIEEINGASTGLSKTTKDDEPITQIVRILNSHLSQLQQIDQGTAALQAKVSAAQKASQTLTLPHGQNGLGNNAADDFYRSYMGRR